jgi:hypothetical protein
MRGTEGISAVHQSLGISGARPGTAPGRSRQLARREGAGAGYRVGDRPRLAAACHACRCRRLWQSAQSDLRLLGSSEPPSMTRRTWSTAMAGAPHPVQRHRSLSRTWARTFRQARVLPPRGLSGQQVGHQDPSDSRRHDRTSLRRTDRRCGRWHRRTTRPTRRRTRPGHDQRRRARLTRSDHYWTTPQPTHPNPHRRKRAGLQGQRDKRTTRLELATFGLGIRSARDDAGRRRTRIICICRTFRGLGGLRSHTPQGVGSRTFRPGLGPNSPQTRRAHATTARSRSVQSSPMSSNASLAKTR